MALLTLLSTSRPPRPRLTEGERQGADFMPTPLAPTQGTVTPIGPLHPGPAQQEEGASTRVGSATPPVPVNSGQTPCQVHVTCIYKLDAHKIRQGSSVITPSHR